MNNNARKKAKKPGKQTAKASVALATSQSYQPPKEVSRSPNSRRIVHRELLGTVNGSVAFTANRYVLNPGMAATFPWLSTQASGWEQYRFNSLCFEYVTRTATSTVGSVIMSPDYDPEDADPADEKAATNAMDAVEDAPWKDQVCRLNSAAMFPLGPRKFIRSSNVFGDLRTFDAGNFFLCTVEEVGADPIGKLWVSYDVELAIPQTAVSAPAATGTSVYQMAANQALATGVSEPIEFTILRVDPLKIGAGAGGVFTPPAGAYFVEATFSLKDTAAESIFVEATLYKNGAATTYSVGNRYTAGGANDYVSGTLIGYVSCNGTDTFNVQIKVTGAAGNLTVDGGSYPATLRVSVA